MRPDAAPAIRAQLITAMEQRAARLDGEARRVLEERLADLRAQDADEPAGACANASPARPLRELLDLLAGEDTAARNAYPEVPALAGFRALWSTLRADSQLRQTVAHTPADAGPLNSTALASRAIALMRDLSPAYLRSFLAYVDDLAWLEQIGSESPASASGAAKRTRRKPRA